jgi:hypothetical protein
VALVEKASREGEGAMTSGTLVFGILVPAAVFAFSYWMTDLLYRHFSKKSDE